MARLPPLDVDTLSAEQKAIIAVRPERVEHGPHTVWLRRPKLAAMASSMMHYLRRGGVEIPPRLTELTILIVARAFTAQFAWAAHEPQARKAGISPDIIEAIRHRRRPQFVKEDEALVYAFATELLDDRKIADATYACAKGMWGEAFVIDLVSLIGCYMMIGANLVAFEVDVSGGAKPLD